MNSKRGWLALLADFEARGEPCVLITVADEQGSTPREAGTKMLVGREAQHLTIGGGHLEYRAVEIAREMLAAGTRQPRLERFSLAASLGQCCGGVTTLLFEPQLAQDVPVIVFGAGHVARALVPLLAGLPCAVRWVDSRAQEFPAVLPAGVEKCLTDEPVDEIARMPAGAYYIVMTHNHPLDLELTDAILARGDHGYFGLIGSRTKWAKFRHRLAARGHGADRLGTVAARWACLRSRASCRWRSPSPWPARSSPTTVARPSRRICPCAWSPLPPSSSILHPRSL